MRKKFFVYLVVAFGIILGYFPLASWLFRPEAAQAQCVLYWINACTGNGCVPPCSGSTRTSVATTYIGSPPYYSNQKRLATCVRP